AFEAFKGLLQRDPGHVDALYALGLLSLEIGDLDAAHDYLSQLYERPARRIEAAFHLGVLEEMRKNLVQALSWYRQVDSSGKQLEAQIRSAGLLAKLGRLPEAQEQLQDLRRANASLAVRLFLAEGELLKQAGRPLDVVDLYERALQQHPGDTTLLYARALAGEDVGRLDILEHDLNEILSQHPDHADALNALGYTLANKTDRFQEAEKYITRALKISPESAAVMDSMGWLQYRLGKYEESVRYLRQAYELNDDSEIAAHLGEALLQLGHSDEARRILEAALLANPGAEDVQRILDQIQGQVQVTP
ncbi:MAG TPA: tetratricopeptide repeat protein, partial [Chromatiales bacterium]|nr:tetratricopeptide repeat protein [Chromatiales bacterium]